MISRHFLVPTNQLSPKSKRGIRASLLWETMTDAKYTNAVSLSVKGVVT